ncbi:MAG TPA: alpha-glucan family phosphorylase [Pyrinomonadaceae bacterium]|nr:alpha-glucan family phosphorylase [Pyrinomonadaceae bacterium]
MKEFSTETLEKMQSAVSLQTEQSYKNDFYYKRDLPDNLKPLETIAWNYYWSWETGGAEIFRELDPSLWEKCEQNPRLLLKQIKQFRLWQKSTDLEYVEKVKRFAEKLENYLREEPKDSGRVTRENPAAYFCAEYGVHNSLPNYSGGLGILAGDHLKSASDLNVPLVAIGLLYRYGYFRQKIAHDGWQEERYLDVFDTELAVKPVLDETGERILVSVHIRGREVFAQAWLAAVGRIKLYLLDTNLPQNSDVDRLITGHLYGGDAETRIVQEKVLGIGGVRLLRKLNLSPSVFHLNEGHSAFLTLELAHEYLKANDSADFNEAINAVREQCVFTTHTPVEAGNDVFPVSTLSACFSADYIESLKITPQEFFALGKTNPEDEKEGFGMTPLALRMARSANGVSEKHGEVSRDLWLKMFPQGTESKDVPITHITNGVHAPTWIAPVLKYIYEKHIGTNWAEILRDEPAWRDAVNQIPDAEIWNAHHQLKQLLVAFIRYKTLSKDTGLHDTINEHEDTRKLFDPNVLTIGFARRVAAYKRWNLLMSDLDRLLKMVDHADRPVQFVFAGKAHPQDRVGKQLLQNLMSINHDSNWQNRAVFIEDYDQEIARYLVQGVDVWMNVPRRPLEASGTSGQKSAMNGGLNFSILDGWWIEGYNGTNGFSIGELNVGDDQDLIDAEDAESLYQVLENEIVPAFYEKDESGLPAQWIRRMKDALITLTPQFSSDRMVMDYLEKIYR